ncbi:MAG TPA: GNAT family protein [Polyangiaceae bacterium]|nr:GNAT family protein [Polyangiaceae bacterium]
MPLSLVPLQAGDVTRLSKFLAGSDWPFHFERSVDDSWVRARIESGHFFGAEARSFWIRGEAAEPLAFARVYDLSDVTPLFDLRVAQAARKQGVGTQALRSLMAWLFAEYPATGRLGGYTRHDNVAMRRVFEKCGFRQEAHHRRAWRVDCSEPVDCVGYAILRSEHPAPPTPLTHSAEY